MNFIVSNNVNVINPDEDIKKYCKKSLILDNPEYTKKERMGFYIGKTPKKINYYTKNGNDLILPFGCMNDLSKTICENEWETDFADVPVDFVRKPEIKLYPYQEIAVKNMVKSKNGILISPTGSGKTIIALDTIGRIGQKALWITHTTELLQQSVNAYKALYEVSEGDIGITKAGKIDIGNKITFALVQTMSKIDLDKYTFGCIICDEIQFAIKSTQNTATFSACMSKFAARHKYGCTAMLHRADAQEKRIKMLFGNVICEVPRNVVADKMITPSLKVIETDVEESFEYLKSDGTLDFCQLQNYLAENKIRNDLIAEMINEEIWNGNSCIVLCDRISQIEDIYSRLSTDEAVIIAGSMTSKKDKVRREQAIEDMRNGDKKCLIASVKLAGAGLDIPILNRLFWISIQKDSGIITQAVGRISRQCEKKSEPIVFDFVDKNINYCVKAYKLRKRQYKKIGVNNNGERYYK